MPVAPTMVTYMITCVCIDSNLAHYTSALFRSVANLTFLTRSARCGDILSAALRAVVNCVKLLVVNMQPLVHFQSLYWNWFDDFDFGCCTKYSVGSSSFVQYMSVNILHNAHTSLALAVVHSVLASQCFESKRAIILFFASHCPFPHNPTTEVTMTQYSHSSCSTRSCLSSAKPN